MPRNVKIAVWVLYFAQIVGLIKQYFYFTKADLKVFMLDKIPYKYKQIIPKELLEQMAFYYECAIYVLVIVSFIGMIYVIFETSHGKNWARILLLISCILTYLFIFGSMIFAFMIDASHQGLSGILSAYRIVIISLEIFALILLFSKSSKLYFQS